VAAERPPATGARDSLLELGLLDVTKAPYLADATGVKDSTVGIQRAVNDARDKRLVCFFPEGTYLVSDTISCEQQVEKLHQPRNTDGRAQHYWDKPHRIALFGSTKGRRPVLKLSKDANGFDDPANPKVAVWIWAQTRDDAPGQQEPQWGKEQPNISFGHIFKGIDIDIRGHAGAIAIRHSGSQGSALLDCTIQAEGAYAGMNNCCGQGGGTYNIQVIGGRHAIVIEPGSRFPLLAACSFRGQTEATLRYAKGGSQVPTLLVGCQIEPAGAVAIDFTTERAYAGISLVDCVVAMKPGGVIARTKQRENIYIENTLVTGAAAVCTQGYQLPAADAWTRIDRYSSQTDQGVCLLNGVQSTNEIAECKRVAAGPDFGAIRARHYTGVPSFEDQDAVNVRDFGAKGDGASDDTMAFEAAIKAHDKVFVPKGNYRLSGRLALRRDTHLFGLTPNTSVIGGASGKRQGRTADHDDSFVVTTVDSAQAAPGLSLLSVKGRVDWRSGQGAIFLTPASLAISGQGGGRIFGMMARGGPLVLKGVRQPLAFYALNVERKGTNPQSEITDCSHIRVYYFKVEAGTLSAANAGNAGDGNTPCRISRSQDVRLYCMYGVVRKLGDRPMLDVVNSRDVTVSQLKTLQPGGFPHLTETVGQNRTILPSSKTCALFIRDSKGEPGNE
jgi:hypothetical protein